MENYGAICLLQLYFETEVPISQYCKYGMGNALEGFLLSVSRETTISFT